MKRLLIVSFDFPPARTSGVYRPTKFVKHLRSFGWEPTVICAKNPSTPLTDVTLLKDIPKDVRIERATVIDFSQLSASIHDALFGRPPERDVGKANSRSPQIGGSGETPVRKVGFLKKYVLRPLQRFVQTWFFVPDSLAGWIPFAFFRAVKVIRQEKPDVIFTTSYPMSTQVVGLFLRFFYRKPWIVDLRDNGVLGYFKNYVSPGRLRLDMWLLRQVLKRADYVLTMCQTNADDIHEAFPKLTTLKTKAITNGYDEDDFGELAGDRRAADSRQLKLLHMGTLYGRTAGAFFDALAELQAEDPKIEEKLEVAFIGPRIASYASKLRELKIDAIVKQLGFKTHPDAIREMMAADILLLFLGGEKIMNQQFPGKFFEYLRTHRPILAVGEKGEILDAVERCRAGIRVKYDDTAAIKRTLLELISAKQRGPIEPVGVAAEYQVYEYRNLTAELVRVLDEVIGKEVIAHARAN